MFPLDGQMLTVPGDAQARAIPATRPTAAIARNARQMLEPPLGDYEGLPALRRFAAELPRWPEEVSDWQWSARFCYQVIERRGTGGGNFRLMYSRFLAEAGRDEARIAAEAAAGWSALAAELLAASEAEAPDAAAWRRIGERAGAVLATEERLWECARGRRLSDRPTRAAAAPRARSARGRRTRRGRSPRPSARAKRGSSRRVVAVEHARVDVGLAADGRGVER